MDWPGRRGWLVGCERKFKKMISETKCYRVVLLDSRETKKRDGPVLFVQARRACTVSDIRDPEGGVQVGGQECRREIAFATWAFCFTICFSISCRLGLGLYSVVQDQTQIQGQ